MGAGVQGVAGGGELAGPDDVVPEIRYASRVVYTPPLFADVAKR